LSICLSGWVCLFVCLSVCRVGLLFFVLRLYFYQVKFTLEQTMKTKRRSRVIICSFFNLGARCGNVVNAKPRPLYPRERNGYPLYRRLVGSQVWSGRVQKMLPAFGIDLWTVYSLASRCIDYALPAHHCTSEEANFFFIFIKPTYPASNA
jgi:hypothetical protein